MTGTGLATVNLSTLTAFQQAVLWVLMGLCTYVYWSRKNRRPIRTTDISEPQNTGSSAQGPAVAPRIRINAFTPDTTPNTSRKHTQHFEEFISQSKEDPEILGTGVFSTSPKAENMDLPSPSPTKMLGDTHSADFASDFLRRRVLTFEGIQPIAPSSFMYLITRRSLEGSVPLPRRTMTVISNASGPFPKTVPGVANKYQGLGGFPGPIELAQKATKYLAPEAYKSMSRSLTMQTSGTIELDDDTVIRTGRNSYFRTDTMSEDDIEKIGGTEYEEKSLGIFEPPPGELEEDLEQLAVRERVGRYLGWHVRQQMSIDIWWLVWGIFVVAICERGNIMNPDKPYISMFPVMFELVSAFAGIGLSLGFPSNNYSLVGTMTKLSKLVIIIIMIRGRHRGLPVAVDRAVLLPNELVTNRELEVDPNQQENEKEIVEVVA
ncbi:hypothetical protein H0H81_004304 [Sphagnurus paluster]|uniref:Uncharacterized protein n=1 Tax=Sphagnurus paluster TaxID=117069 RepID=A0A9P7GS19_9AGAR|nr:hypothetical protein H0H81_004304 [Sphagnurus paluster]